MERKLLIFTKNPILGTAKTRIGKVKGNEVALAVYKALLVYTRDVSKVVEADKIVFFNQYLEGNEGIWSESFQQKMQVSGDLGTKMSVAIEEEFNEGASKVVIIGSDCAELEADEIEEAFTALDTDDVVVGPAEDGGYYLLGMNRLYPELFADMPWSEESLLEETLERAADLNISVKKLKMKSDIDFWEDWEKLGWNLEF